MSEVHWHGWEYQRLFPSNATPIGQYKAGRALWPDGTVAGTSRPRRSVPSARTATIGKADNTSKRAPVTIAIRNLESLTFSITPAREVMQIKDLCKRLPGSLAMVSRSYTKCATAPQTL